MQTSNSSSEQTESIVYRLQNIYFKIEQLSSSLAVATQNRSQSNIANDECIELISSKQKYLSELDEALSNNQINNYCFNIACDKLQSQFSPESYFCYSTNDNILNHLNFSVNPNEHDTNTTTQKLADNCLTFDGFDKFCHEFQRENKYLKGVRSKLNVFNTNARDTVENDSIEFLFDHLPVKEGRPMSTETLSAITNNLEITSNRQPVPNHNNNVYGENNGQPPKFSKVNSAPEPSPFCNYNQMPAPDTNLLGKNASIQRTTTIKYEPRVSKCYKRRNGDNDDDNIETNSAGTHNTNNSNETNNKQSAFKTAKEQLVIENAKKDNHGFNGGSGGSFGGGGGNNQYNSGLSAQTPIVKKSLGTTKRGIHSKFNLPIPKNEEQQKPQMNNASGGGSSGCPSELSDVDMSKMKNIEPKLIETIMSEIMDRTPPITWNDIAGLEFVKKTIKEIVIWPMLRPDIFNGLRGPPKGLLLFGPPGTGKTLIAKCIANESKSKFFNISSSCLTSKWQGESEKLVKVLFEVARSLQPSVIFIDEIDSLLAARSDDDRESSRRLKTEFFVQMDGARTTGEERILLIGATNRPQELDDAARRRFVKRLYIPLPEKEGRKQIVQNLMNKQASYLSDQEIECVAELTDGYSGADMTNLCREAALGPIRSLEVSSIETIDVDQVQPINFNHFEDAMKQVRASVSQDDLEQYYKWNSTFGSLAITK